MKTIDTWEGLEAALASNLPPPVKHILTATRDRLAEFADHPLATLCTVLILEAGDRLDPSLDPALAEYIAYTNGWFELVFVTGDDGAGFVVLIEDCPASDQTLLDHCRVNLTD